MWFLYSSGRLHCAWLLVTSSVMCSASKRAERMVVCRLQVRTELQQEVESLMRQLERAGQLGTQSVLPATPTMPVHPTFSRNQVPACTSDAKHLQPHQLQAPYVYGFQVSAAKFGLSACVWFHAARQDFKVLTWFGAVFTRISHHLRDNCWRCCAEPVSYKAGNGQRQLWS